MDDPKKRFPDAPINKRDVLEEPSQPDMTSLLVQMAQMQQETARLIAEMKSSGSSANAGVVETLLEQQAQLLVKTRPENTDHPGVSVYSYPEGDLKRPKPDLKCQFIWCGQEESKDQLTPEEIELRNRLEPGNYFVTKANGTRIKFNVTPKYTDGGKLEQLTVWYPCKGDQKGDHMSNVAYLRQVLGEEVLSIEQLMAENAKLRAAAAELTRPVAS
jgi:hypothetical protein